MMSGPKCWGGKKTKKKTLHNVHQLCKATRILLDAQEHAARSYSPPETEIKCNLAKRGTLLGA